MDNSVNFKSINGSRMSVACDSLDAIKITGNGDARYIQLYYSEISNSPSYQLDVSDDFDLKNFRSPSFDMEGDVDNGVVFYKKDRVASIEDTGSTVWITLKSGEKFKCLK